MNNTPREVTVLGAGGRTGRRIVEQALRAGHRVTAAVRSPERFPTLDIADLHAPHLRIVRADVRDADSLEPAIDGRDVVVSAIGPPGRHAGQLYSEAARATVTAMQRRGVSRIVAITSAGVRYDDRELAVWYRLLVRPLIRDLYADMIVAERIVRDGDLDWTFVRPVLLLDRDSAGSYRVCGEATPDRGRTISCAEVAQFIVGEIDEQQWSRRAPTLAR